MSASLNLGKYAGIKVQIHWTFWLLFLFIGLMVFTQGGDVADLFWHSLFIFGIFFCVVLHEFGHALTARKYNIGTQSITLLPIGGVASLKKIPENPYEELMIAIAGPAVNIVIALLILPFVPLETYTGMEAEALENELSSIGAGNMLFYLFMANIALVLFNIIPAFPMDGGRIFRALLSMRMGRLEATRIASGLGKFMAMIFFLVGLFYSIILAVIAVFIWFGAHSENIMIQQLELMRGYSIRDAMITEYSLLHPDDNLNKAVEKILSSTQQDFVVYSDSDVKGILYMSDLAEALRNSGRDTPVRNVMDEHFIILDADEPLTNAYRKIRRNNRNFFPVIKNGTIVGVLDMNNINEFLTFRSSFDF